MGLVRYVQCLVSVLYCQDSGLGLDVWMNEWIKIQTGLIGEKLRKVGNKEGMGWDGSVRDGGICLIRSIYRGQMQATSGSHTRYMGAYTPLLGLYSISGAIAHWQGSAG